MKWCTGAAATQEKKNSLERLTAVQSPVSPAWKPAGVALEAESVDNKSDRKCNCPLHTALGQPRHKLNSPVLSTGDANTKGWSPSDSRKVARRTNAGNPGNYAGNREEWIWGTLPATCRDWEYRTSRPGAAWPRKQADCKGSYVCSAVRGALTWHRTARGLCSSWRRIAIKSIGVMREKHASNM